MKYKPSYYKEHFVEKFNNALDKKYSLEKKTKRRKAFIDDYDKYYSDNENGSTIEQSVKQWLRPNNRTVPKVDTLVKICNILKCESDYFLTSQSYLNKEIGKAADTIGLPEDTVAEIATDPTPMRYFLEQYPYEDFCIAINSYVENARLHSMYYGDDNADFVPENYEEDDELIKYEKYQLPSFSDDDEKRWVKYEREASAMLAVIRDDLSKKLSEILLSLYDPSYPDDYDKTIKTMEYFDFDDN